MSRSTIQARITAILAAQAGVDPASVAAEATLDSLGLDSMAVVEVIFALEEAFDITVPFNANRPEESGLGGISVAGLAEMVAALTTAPTE